MEFRVPGPIWLWAVVAVITVLVAQFISGRDPGRFEITNAEFTTEAKKGNLGKLHVVPHDVVSEVFGELESPATTTLSGKPVKYTLFRTFYPAGHAALTDVVLADNPGLAITSGPPPSSTSSVATYIPFIILIVMWFGFIRRMAGRTQRPQMEA